MTPLRHAIHAALLAIAAAPTTAPVPSAHAAAQPLTGPLDAVRKEQEAGQKLVDELSKGAPSAFVSPRDDAFMNRLEQYARDHPVEGATPQVSMSVGQDGAIDGGDIAYFMHGTRVYHVKVGGDGKVLAEGKTPDGRAFDTMKKFDFAYFSGGRLIAREAFGTGSDGLSNIQYISYSDDSGRYRGFMNFDADGNLTRGIVIAADGHTVARWDGASGDSPAAPATSLAAAPRAPVSPPPEQSAAQPPTDPVLSGIASRYGAVAAGRIQGQLENGDADAKDAARIVTDMLSGDAAREAAARAAYAGAGNTVRYYVGEFVGWGGTAAQAKFNDVVTGSVLGQIAARYGDYVAGVIRSLSQTSDPQMQEAARIARDFLSSDPATANAAAGAYAAADSTTQYLVADFVGYVGQDAVLKLPGMTQDNVAVASARTVGRSFPAEAAQQGVATAERAVVEQPLLPWPPAQYIAITPLGATLQDIFKTPAKRTYQGDAMSAGYTTGLFPVVSPGSWDKDPDTFTEPRHLRPQQPPIEEPRTDTSVKVEQPVLSPFEPPARENLADAQDPPGDAPGARATRPVGPDPTLAEQIETSVVQTTDAVQAEVRTPDGDRFQFQFGPDTRGILRGVQTPAGIVIRFDLIQGSAMFAPANGNARLPLQINLPGFGVTVDRPGATEVQVDDGRAVFSANDFAYELKYGPGARAPREGGPLTVPSGGEVDDGRAVFSANDYVYELKYGSGATAPGGPLTVPSGGAVVLTKLGDVPTDSGGPIPLQVGVFPTVDAMLSGTHLLNSTIAGNALRNAASQPNVFIPPSPRGTVSEDQIANFIARYGTRQEPYPGANRDDAIRVLSNTMSALPQNNQYPPGGVLEVGGNTFALPFVQTFAGLGSPTVGGTSGTGGTTGTGTTTTTVTGSGGVTPGIGGVTPGIGGVTPVVSGVTGNAVVGGTFLAQDVSAAHIDPGVGDFGNVQVSIDTSLTPFIISLQSQGGGGTLPVDIVGKLVNGETHNPTIGRIIDTTGTRFGVPWVSGGVNGGIHVVYGVRTPFAELPTTGTFTYNFVATTSPTYSNGATAPGSLAGSAVVDFASLRVGVAMTATMPNQVFTIQTPGGTATPGSSTVRIPAGQPRFIGTGPYTTGTSICTSGCTTLIGGQFFGLNGTFAGILFNTNLPGLTSLSGAALGKR